ncbi:MAG: hypothetical protein CFH06_00135 [Alphaproteobacteria bacterium MarineAlpha3_Bin5]|nr:flagellar biosynthetic protein FliR [Magnetovibrio sp.]PPR80078.1 MAG: hypothetical protein CFH06_00135 [Alphaproteobacteria bacterium MarineAlpha3_Bin5]
MLNEFLNLNIFSFFMVFARIGTAVVFFPGFGSTYVSIRIRLVFGLALSFVLTPILFDFLPERPTSVAELFLMFIGEVVVGGFLASIARILVAILQITGTFVSLFASMANSLVQDPITEQQTSTISSFFGIVGLIAIFAADLHHLMIRSIVDGYELFVPGQPLLFGDFSMSIARRIADAFALGLQLAMPVAVVSLIYYIGLGILGRLMPQLPVFFFGLPFQLTVQIWIMSITVSGLMIVFLRQFSETYAPYLKTQ